MSCPDVKRCRMCGTIISDANDPNTDWMSHISIKYCPKCAELRTQINKRNWAAKSRDVKKTVDNYMQEYCQVMLEKLDGLKSQNDLLKQENDALRKQIIELRG